MNSDPEEVVVIQKNLLRLGSHFSIHWVKDGRAALDVLMGSRALTVRPDYLIASSLLPDMSSFELFSIIRKYYRLMSLKFILLTDRAEGATEIFDTITVNGYLHRPLKDDQKTADKIALLFSPDDKRRLAYTGIVGITSIPGGLSMLQQKLASIGGLIPAAKVATFAACAITPVVIINQTMVEESTGQFNTVMVDVTTLGETISASAVNLNFDQPEVVKEEVPEEVPETIAEEQPVVIEEPLQSPVPEQVQEKQADTIYEKKFSIGVKRLDPKP